MTESEFYAWLDDPENPDKIPPELLMTPEDKRAVVEERRFRKMLRRIES